uniref:F-box domain-containing protein n=1 Tax=Quercus lobata TaxID=97700 RepID=A0A7N2MXT3_QUELO
MARQQNFAEDGDLFNKLPDSIVHHILCLLDLKDRSRLSCVSRRYRELCISAPWVTLNNTDLTPRRFLSNNFVDRPNLTRRFLFNNFVDRLLSLRSWHGVKIQNFILQWDFGELFEEEAYRIDTWLYHVVNLGVQKIAFQLTTQRFALPQCVLDCKSIVVLYINTNDGILKLPSTSSAAAGFGINTTLEALVLFSVRIEGRRLFWRMAFTIQVPLGIESYKNSLQIEDDYFGEWLSHFKSLKVLILTRVSGIKSMSIHNSSIDVLEIQHCNDLVDISIFAEKLRRLHVRWYPYNNNSSGFGSLKISAPNLENFRWVGRVVDYHCRGDFSHKLNLTIDLSLSDQLYESSTKYSLRKILHSMQRAKVLTLRDEFVEVNYTPLLFQTTFILSSMFLF